MGDEDQLISPIILLDKNRKGKRLKDDCFHDLLNEHLKEEEEKINF